jgi:hypothetical protein
MQAVLSSVKVKHPLPAGQGLEPGAQASGEVADQAAAVLAALRVQGAGIADPAGLDAGPVVAASQPSGPHCLPSQSGWQPQSGLQPDPSWEQPHSQVSFTEPTAPQLSPQ